MKPTLANRTFDNAQAALANAKELLDQGQISRADFQRLAAKLGVTLDNAGNGPSKMDIYIAQRMGR